MQFQWTHSIRHAQHAVHCEKTAPPANTGLICHLCLSRICNSVTIILLEASGALPLSLEGTGIPAALTSEASQFITLLGSLALGYNIYIYFHLSLLFILEVLVYRRFLIHFWNVDVGILVESEKFIGFYKVSDLFMIFYSIWQWRYHYQFFFFNYSIMFIKSLFY